MTSIEAVTGKGVIYARPYDHETVEIHWSVPESLIDTWLEVAIVRSVYGAPSTPMDGVTVFRGLKADLFPEGVPTNSAGNLLVPAVFDSPNSVTLNPGRWYYYSLFFRSTAVEWQRVMSTSAQLPRNFHHDQHLWNNVPPYYQLTDDQYRGHLRQFLNVFGFELDTTREYVDQWQNLYNIDACPMPLLRRLGENFDLPYESGLGDIRYRSLMADLGHLYDIRGTQKGVEQMIAAASKYECDITPGSNMMVLPDDSDFFSGTGNWAGLHPDADSNAIVAGVTVVPATDVFMEANPTGGASAPENYGRGTMRVESSKATETTELLITCGCGITSETPASPSREITPLLGGITVEAGHQYGFTYQITMEKPSIHAPKLLWFGASGSVTDLISVTTGTYLVPTPTPEAPWDVFTVEGTAPAGARFLVPCIHIDSRIGWTYPDHSPFADFAGAMVYEIGGT